VIFASRVCQANRISLQGEAYAISLLRSKNITLSKTAYHSNYQEMRTYSPPNAAVQLERADTKIIRIGSFNCPLEPEAESFGILFYFLKG